MLSLGANSLALAAVAIAGAFFAAVLAGKRRDVRWLGASRWLFTGFAGLLTLTSLALLHLLVYSDFRVAYVASYTELALPVGYKLAAFWAGQEGSLLLWAWLLAALNLGALYHWRSRPVIEQASLMAVLGLVSGFFVILLVFAADPFRLAPVAAADGHGLNPLLQDWAMLLHPPALFVGYAGYTVPFAMLVAVLIAGRTDNLWLRDARPWLLFSWVFLGIGILLGAFWAYVELGWGGYWAWDPVENASLLPWLTGTALLHSIMIQQRRGMFKGWNAGLIVATFLLCIFGTFLTRSGIVASVHTFGSSKISDLWMALFNAASVDPKELIAPLFMVFLLLGTGLGFGLVIWKRKLLASEHTLDRLVSREGAFLAANVLLVLATAVVMIGTVFPVLSSAVLGRSIEVGEPFYNQAVVPLLLVLIALMAVGPLLISGREAGQHLVKGVTKPALIAGVATVIAFFAGMTNPWALACLFLGLVALVLIVLDEYHAARQKQRHTSVGLGAAALAVLDANHRRYGGLMAHVGVILMMAGIAGSSLFGEKHDVQLAPNQSVAVGDYTVSIEPLREVRAESDHYTAVETTVLVQDAAGRTIRLIPQTRFYDKASNPHSEIALYSTLLTDVYINLAGWEDGGRQVALQILINPLTMWLWIGSTVLILGASLALLPSLMRRRAGRSVAEREPSEPAMVRLPTAHAAVKTSS